MSSRVLQRRRRARHLALRRRLGAGLSVGGGTGGAGTGGGGAGAAAAGFIADVIIGITTPLSRSIAWPAPNCWAALLRSPNRPPPPVLAAGMERPSRVRGLRRGSGRSRPRVSSPIGAEIGTSPGAGRPAAFEIGVVASAGSRPVTGGVVRPPGSRPGRTGQRRVESRVGRRRGVTRQPRHARRAARCRRGRAGQRGIG